MSKVPAMIVYDAQSASSFSAIFRSIWKGFREGYSLGRQLAIRDIKAMYRQSLLGLLWAVVAPVSQAAVWIFLSSRGVINIGDTGVPYALYVLSGVMIWQIFIESLNAPLMMFNSAKGILKKININKESLLIASLIKVLFNVLIKLVVLIPLLFIFDVPLGLNTLLAFPALMAVIGFGLVLGTIITPVGALYTDVQRFIQSFAQLFFLLTPIIYPARTEGWFGLMDKFNPASISVTTARDLFIGLDVTDWSIFLGFYGLVAIAGVIGLMIYKISMPIIVERMGS